MPVDTIFYWFNYFLPPSSFTECPAGFSWCGIAGRQGRYLNWTGNNQKEDPPHKAAVPIPWLRMRHDKWSGLMWIGRVSCPATCWKQNCQLGFYLFLALSIIRAKESHRPWAYWSSLRQLSFYAGCWWWLFDFFINRHTCGCYLDNSKLALIHIMFFLLFLDILCFSCINISRKPDCLKPVVEFDRSVTFENRK